MTRQQKAESLKRRYGRHGAPEAKGPMGGRGHGPGRNMGMGPKRLPRNAGTTTRRLLHYLNEDKPKMVLAFFCVILNTAATLAGSYMLRPVINTFIAPLTGGPGDPAGLARALTVLAAVFAVGVFANYAQAKVMLTVAQNALQKIRNDLFARMQKLPVRFYDTNSNGDLMSRFTNDVDTIGQMLSSTLVQLFSGALSIIGTLFLMLYTNLILTLVTLVMIPIMMKVKGGMLLAIAITTVIGIPFGVTTWSNSQSISETFSQLPQTFGAIFSAEGFPALFSDVSKLPLVIVTIFAFSMSDTFDTLGTFIGTGRRTGIFSAEDEKALENGHGFSSKMDKALFADSIATSIGAICGTSNTTTYVESSAGIAAGGRTGLTSVVVAICFALSAFLAPVVSAVPSAATAGVLVIVGCMMAASLKEVKWDDIAEAIPAFFAAVFMAFSYSISYGIAGGFIMYCIVKTCKGKAKEVHPIIWTVAALFILDFVCMAIL